MEVRGCSSLEVKGASAKIKTQDLLANVTFSGVFFFMLSSGDGVVTIVTKG